MHKSTILNLNRGNKIPDLNYDELVWIALHSGSYFSRKTLCLMDRVGVAWISL